MEKRYWIALAIALAAIVSALLMFWPLGMGSPDPVAETAGPSLGTQPAGPPTGDSSS
jgi:hypothetical protein